MATSRDYGTPATGSPLYAATIGVEDLPRSLALYGDAMGLDVLERRAVANPAFAAHWRMPRDACAEVAVLADRRAEAGRIVLVQFDAPARRPS